MQLTHRTLGGVSMFNISNRMSWADVVDYLRPYMFRISTPRGFGTGFALSLHANKTLCAVATAAHVVDHAHYWEEPVRLEHVASKQVLVARPATRAIFLDEARDTAVVLIAPGNITIPEKPLPLGPKSKHYRVGNQIGW